MDESDNFEQGHVYRIPPRQTSAGYRCADWDPNSKGPLAIVRVRVIGIGDKVEIRLEEAKTNNLFATCIVHEDMTAIEQVIDSSRYFAMRITDDSGHRAFIGLGFQERATAFDLNVALQDHFKWVRSKKGQASREDLEERDREREMEAENERAGAGASEPGPTGMALKEGETIKVAIGGRASRRRPQAAAGGGGGGGSGDGGGVFLPPPPGTGGGPAVPASASAAAGQAQGQAQPKSGVDELADLFGGAAVTSAPARAPGPGPAQDSGGWATFD